MIIKHKTQRRYQYGGSGIFDIVGKLASKIAAKTPDLINKVAKEVVKQGEKALVDNSGKLAKATVKKMLNKKPKGHVRDAPTKDDIAKQMGTDLINSFPPKSQPKNTLASSTNLNSLISGMGLKPLAMGSGIILD